MEFSHALIFLLATAIAISALSPRLKMPYPVLLMVAGVVVGFVPGFIYIPVEPEIIFLVFLPPLLYDAAVNVSFPGFKRDIGTISMLAVTMVFITMAAIAVVSRYCIPGISWPVAFVIGAILSPPDAVAATAIIKDMALPGRTKIILEGESLVNDASALTAYRIALGVVTGGVFVVWKAVLEFVVIIAGGIFAGIVAGFIFVLILRRVPFTSTATVCLNILLPFVAYQLAESMSFSGVLAVVTAGLVVARRKHRNKLFSEMTIEESRSVWDVIIYIINGIVFIMIGMEFPQALREIPSTSILPLILSSFLIFLIALAVRMIVLFERKFRIDKLEDIARHGEPRFNRRKFIRRIRTLDWKNSFVVGWSGMRGIVSVATALALPVVFADGTPFTQRNSIIFVTVVVVVLMLVIQGLGLPFIIRILKIKPELEKMDISDRTI